MQVLTYKKEVIVVLVAIFSCIGVSYCDDSEVDNVLAVEQQLLESMQSRYNEVYSSVLKDGSLDKDNASEIDKEKYGRYAVSEENSSGKVFKVFKVFKDIKGLRIVKRLHEFGIYLYSINANQIKLGDVLNQIALSADLKIEYQMIEPQFLRKRVDLSLKNIPLRDLLEIVTGIFGFDFIQKENKPLKITIPSNMGFERPEDYFKNKIVKMYRKLQIKYPNNENIPETHYKLANYFYSLGLKLFASQEYMVVAEKSPKHPLAKVSLMKMGQCFMDIQDLQKARDIYNKYIERYPRDEALENVYWAITNSWFVDGKYDIAITLYEKILEMYPMSGLSSKISERIALSHMKTGNYSKAFDLFIALKKRIDPVDWSAENDFMIGESLYQMSMIADSFVVFTSIIGKDGLDEEKNRLAMLRVAECLDKMDRCVEAIQAYKSWMIKTDKQTYGMFSIGKCLRRLDLYTQAIRILNDAMVLNDTDEQVEDIKFELAMSYYDNSQYGNALELFEDLLSDESSEKFVDSNFYGAESLFFKKDYKDAIPFYEKLVPLLVMDTNRQQHVEKRLAVCYQNLGQFSKAMETYK